MKAFGYIKPGPLETVEFQSWDLPEPALRDYDVLVRVRAVSVNPVDAKVRRMRPGEPGKPVILGWDAAGVIEKLGSKVTGFKVGEPVYYAGEIDRMGSNAELQAVDSRLIAHKPENLSFAEAAALPLTSLTAWESLIEPPVHEWRTSSRVLVIGGAGGVGSIAVQLLKTLTTAQVIATAARKETQAFVRNMGADLVLDHSKDLRDEFRQHDITGVDVIFGTTHTERYQTVVPDLLLPFGHYVVIDDPATLDIVPFKKKALRVHWELMFTKSLYQHDMATQGRILDQVRQLVERKAIRSTAHTILHGLNESNLRQSHELLESGRTVGKIVIDLG